MPTPITITRKPTGLTPWHAVTTSDEASVKDRNGNTLFICRPGIAHRIVAAVNAHADLASDNERMREAFQDLTLRLRSATRTPVIADALCIIDAVLAEDEVERFEVSLR